MTTTVRVLLFGSFLCLMSSAAWLIPYFDGAEYYGGTPMLRALIFVHALLNMVAGFIFSIIAVPHPRRG